MKTSPNISEALLSWLEKTFPDKLPDQLVDQGVNGRLVGRQDVIRRLRAEHIRQLKPMD